MPAPSLLDISLRECIRHVQSITDVGRFEYWKIRPILLRIKTPSQLQAIEAVSPQIAGESAELWKAFIARDIINWERKNYVPKNPKNWAKVYRKYVREQEAEVQRDAETLAKSFSDLKKEKKEKASEVVNVRLSGPRVKKQVGNRAMPRNNSILAWTGGSKTKMNDGKGVLLRARREAREIKDMRKIAKPTGELDRGLGLVNKAPRGMVDQYRTAQQPAFQIHTPKQRLVVNKPLSPVDAACEAREAKLKALQSGGGMAGPKRDSTKLVTQTYVDDSSESEGPSSPLSATELEDLFDEIPGSQAPPSSSQSSPPTIASQLKPAQSMGGLKKGFASPKTAVGSKSPSVVRKIQQPRLKSSQPKSENHQQSQPSISPPLGGNIQAEGRPSPAQRSKPMMKRMSQPSMSPPLVGNSQAGRRPPPSQGSKPMMKRKKEVDIFARPKKIRRI